MDTSELSSLFTTSELVQMAMTPEVAKTYYAVRRVTWHPPQDPDEFVESVLQVLRRHPEQTHGDRGAVAPEGRQATAPSRVSAGHPRERDGEEGRFGGAHQACARRAGGGCRRRRHHGLLGSPEHRLRPERACPGDGEGRGGHPGVPAPAGAPGAVPQAVRGGAGMGPQHDDGHTERPDLR